MDKVERHRTRPPTKTGWYYARRFGLPGGPVRVVLVAVPGSSCRQLRVLQGGDHIMLKEFDWYGPVPVCALLD